MEVEFRFDAVEKARSQISAKDDRCALWVSIWIGLSISLGNVATLDYVVRYPRFLYFEEIRMFQTGARLEYISME